MDSGRAYPCFSDHLVQEGAVQSSVIYCHHETTFHGEVRGRQYHGIRDKRTSNGGSSLCKVRNWLGDSGLVATLQRGGDNLGEVRNLTFQGKNPRSDLDWLCLAMASLKALF
jgi:hypothetical protein